MTLGEKKLVYPFSPHWKNNLYRNSALRRFALLLGWFIIKPMAGMFPGMAPILTPQTAARGGRGRRLEHRAKTSAAFLWTGMAPSDFLLFCWDGSSSGQWLGCFQAWLQFSPPFPSVSSFFEGKAAAVLRRLNHTQGGMPLSRKAMVRSTMMANSPEQSSIKRPKSLNEGSDQNFLNVNFNKHP